jgi:hypothetical protein
MQNKVNFGQTQISSPFVLLNIITLSNIIIQTKLLVKLFRQPTPKRVNLPIPMAGTCA